MIERRRSQQIDLSADREIREQRRRQPRRVAEGAPHGGDRIAQQRIIVVELGNRALSFFEDAPFQMTKPPGDFVVLMAFGRRFAPATLQVSPTAPTPAASTAGSVDTSARRVSSIVEMARPSALTCTMRPREWEVVLKMDPDQIRTRWEVAKREAPILAGDRECGGRAKGGDDSTRQRPSQLVFDDACQLGRFNRSGCTRRLQLRSQSQLR